MQWDLAFGKAFPEWTLQFANAFPNLRMRFRFSEGVIAYRHRPVGMGQDLDQKMSPKKPGFRRKGRFVAEHDRGDRGEPMGNQRE